MSAGAMIVDFISDVHFGEHDERAVETYTRFAEDHRPDVRIWGGDIMELAAGSSHGVHLERLSDDLTVTREGIEQMRARAPAEREVWIEGNHETRYQRYLRTHAPHFADALPSLPELLGLPELGFDEFVPYGAPYFADPAHDLCFTHGSFAGTNHLRRHLDRYRCSVVYGHVHRPAGTTSPVPVLPGHLTDGHLVAVANGCMRTLNPAWQPAPTGWAHGFTRVCFGLTGQATVYPVLMRDAAFTWISGTTYDAR